MWDMASLKRSKATRRLSATATGLIALFITTSVAADAYLDALKAEARSEKQLTLPKPADADRANLRTDDQVQMEDWLKQEFIGTYAFYQKLSDSKKSAIHRLYRAGAPIEELRTRINELLKQ